MANEVLARECFVRDKIHGACQLADNILPMIQPLCNLFVSSQTDWLAYHSKGVRPQPPRSTVGLQLLKQCRGGALH